MNKHEYLNAVGQALVEAGYDQPEATDVYEAFAEGLTVRQACLKLAKKEAVEPEPETEYDQWKAAVHQHLRDWMIYITLHPEEALKCYVEGFTPLQYAQHVRMSIYGN